MSYFKITKGKKVEIVKTDSMISVDKYCKNNGYAGWEMVGMMSRSELAQSKLNCRRIK